MPPEWALLGWQFTSHSLSVVYKVYAIKCLHAQTNLLVSAPTSVTLLLIRISSYFVNFSGRVSILCAIVMWIKKQHDDRHEQGRVIFFPITHCWSSSHPPPLSSSSSSFIGLREGFDDWVWGGNGYKLFVFPECMYENWCPTGVMAC